MCVSILLHIPRGNHNACITEILLQRVPRGVDNRGPFCARDTSSSMSRFTNDVKSLASRKFCIIYSVMAAAKLEDK